MGTAESARVAAAETRLLKDMLLAIPSEVETTINTHHTTSGGGGGGLPGGIPEFQHGLDFVPFDEFPAILHKGERVLTAEENKQFNDNRNFGGNQTTYNVYNPMAAAILAADRQNELMDRLDARM